jgi:hypothetical protein
MHYHVVSLEDDGNTYKLNNVVVRRHYTTTNILEKNQYANMVSMIEAYTGTFTYHEDMVRQTENSKDKQDDSKDDMSQSKEFMNRVSQPSISSQNQRISINESAPDFTNFFSTKS